MRTYDPTRGAGPAPKTPTHAEKEARARITAQHVHISVVSPTIPRASSRKKDAIEILHRGTRCTRLNTGYVSGTLTLLTTVTKGGWKALKVLRSGLVPSAVSQYRNAVCFACPHVSKVKIKKKVLHFCACCSCGIWTSTEDGAEIESKNTHAKNMCPEDPPRFGEYAGEPITKKRSFMGVIPSLVRAAYSMLLSGRTAIHKDPFQKQ